jgi:hypothetical protein
VENHEPCDERHAVRHEVGDVHEEHPRRMRQAHPQGLLVRVLGRQGQHDRGADGDGAERQGLADQVRPAFPLPRPAAQDVADRRAGEPGRDRRFARCRVRGPEQERQHDLARREGDDRHGHEPAEPLAQRGPEPAPQGRDKPGRNECHGSPSYSEDRQVIQTGIQYGNRTRLEVGDLHIEAGPCWRGRRRAAGAGHRRRAPPQSGADRGSIGAAGREQSKRHTDKAGARS